jgi:hypothetical protein
MLRNHIIIAITFSPIDFKKRLSRRDTDERFHLSTAQDKVKNSTKAPSGKYGPQGMTTLIYLVSLNMCLHLCCLASLALLQVLALLKDEQKFKLGGCVGAHKTQILCANISSKCMK